MSADCPCVYLYKSTHREWVMNKLTLSTVESSVYSALCVCTGAISVDEAGLGFI